MTQNLPSGEQLCALIREGWTLKERAAQALSQLEPLKEHHLAAVAGRAQAADRLLSQVRWHMDNSYSCLGHDATVMSMLQAELDEDWQKEHIRDTIADDLAFREMIFPNLSVEGLVLSNILLGLEQLRLARHTLERGLSMLEAAQTLAAANQ